MWAAIATGLAWLRHRPAQALRGRGGQSGIIGLVLLAAVLGLLWARRDAVSDYAAVARADQADAQLAADRAGEDAAARERAKIRAEADRAALAAARQRQAETIGAVERIVIPKAMAMEMNK